MSLVTNRHYFPQTVFTDIDTQDIDEIVYIVQKTFLNFLLCLFKKKNDFKLNGTIIVFYHLLKRHDNMTSILTLGTERSNKHLRYQDRFCEIFVNDKVYSYCDINRQNLNDKPVSIPLIPKPLLLKTYFDLKMFSIFIRTDY